LFRGVVAELLGHQRDMRVLRAPTAVADEGTDARGRATQGAVADTPDVVVYGIPPRGAVTRHAPEYRDMASTGAAIVVFCTSPEQAADFEDLGVEYVVDANEPARELAAAVREAYRHRAGHTIH
jgi:D-arabinose 1-dehydrogenase-like Zn-dependent alcohol dehydrogenase